MKRIYVATTNKGKLKELETIFGELDMKVISVFDEFEDVADVEETGANFEENARLKAETIANIYKIPVVADDSGLSVYAIGGEPGVYSARYAGGEKNDQRNLEKVLDKMKGLDDRKAAFVCSMAFARPHQPTVIAEGRCEGEISEQPQGEGGFGYDPIFIPEDYDQTLSQLGTEVKNSISHRRKALDGLIEKIRPLI
ncbi:XTP/dITP diphosphatase [Halalkalibacillus halophilus]|uniref:XTP/dITP diphosphatase n=1 Tax=Halalkalibacillus halophilus TaxID=392827 RepID=UPI0004047D37|nr:XTP/dITP diphosphatase [Halalkalibacillus halophilus]